MASFQDHLKYASSSTQPLALELDKVIRGLGNVANPVRRHVTNEQRIAYSISTKRQFLELKIQKDAILVRFKRTILADPQKVITEIPKSHDWPWDQEITVTDGDTLRYATRFIEAAHQKSLHSKD
jgi:hypothetical protein